MLTIARRVSRHGWWRESPIARADRQLGAGARWEPQSVRRSVAWSVYWSDDCSPEQESSMSRQRKPCYTRTHGGRQAPLCMALLCLLSIAAVAADPPPRAAANGAAQGLRTLAFDCGSVPLLVVLLADNATVYLPDRGVTLTRLPDGGKGPQTFADAHSRFRLRDATAELDIAGKRYRNCREDRVRAFWQAAQLRGAVFRATGAGLLWTLDVLEPRSAATLRYSAAAGGATLWFRDARRDGALDDDATVYNAESADHRISVRIVNESCTEPALPARFSARVLLTLDGHASAGCGGAVP